jgi:PDZ domain-containing protein
MLAGREEPTLYERNKPHGASARFKDIRTYRVKGNIRGVRRLLPPLLLMAIAVYLLFFVSVPYYVYRPGTAEAVKPMVRVAEGDPEEAGAFLLTTVRMGQTNVAGLIWAQFNRQWEIRKKADVLRGESEQEYVTRQEYIMLDSQSNAIQAAYRRADIPYQIRSQGVVVMRTIKGMPADGVLQPGDRIVTIDGKPVTTHQEIVDLLATKREGDTVEVTVKRNDEEKSFTIAVKLFDEATGGDAAAQRPGLGISTAELLSIVPERDGQRVTIDAGDIGGPSAGLMFALEIYNQLTPGDLTKGYRVAGTGTIDPQGNVCSIGGIRHKIVAADRENADVFFAPIDRKAGECGLTADVPNFSDALDQAKRIGTSMKVVPVATMEEALRYLDQLPPKR